MNRYTLQKIDDKVWVDLRPLMNDVHDTLQQLCKVDISSMNAEEKRVYDLRLLGLQSVYTFLGALLAEYDIKENIKSAEAQLANVQITTVH
jgi:hypothetical protein